MLCCKGCVLDKMHEWNDCFAWYRDLMVYICQLLTMEVYDSRERRLPYRRTAHSLTFRLTSSLCSQKTKNIQQSRFAGGHPCLGIPKYDWNNSGFFLYSAILILYGEIYLQVLFPTFSPTIISHPHDFSFINTHYTASSVRVRT